LESKTINREAGLFNTRVSKSSYCKYFVQFCNPDNVLKNIKFVNETNDWKTGLEEVHGCIIVGDQKRVS